MEPGNATDGLYLQIGCQMERHHVLPLVVVFSRNNTSVCFVQPPRTDLPDESLFGADQITCPEL